MKSAIEVILPSGSWIGGSCNRSALLRPITGEDEAFLLETGEGLPPAQWVTALLARCLVGLEPLDHVTMETVRSLSVGDREALLLHLHRLTFGDKMQCVLACPSPKCKEKMDLDLKATELLLPPYSNVEEWHEAQLIDAGHSYRVRFRLPTGADQEASAGLALTDLRAASKMLLRRCLGGIERDNGSPVEIIPEALDGQISSMMAELDPQAELILNLTCPTCGNTFSALFDTASYLSKEMNCHLEQIYREVHVLAFYYHWSESEIMGMTQKKRQRYLELLDEAMKEWR